LKRPGINLRVLALLSAAGFLSGCGAGGSVSSTQSATSSHGAILSPSLSMIRYMVYQYEHLSQRGETYLANQMAFEVVQRVNLEAATTDATPQAVLAAAMGLADGTQLWNFFRQRAAYAAHEKPSSTPRSTMPEPIILLPSRGDPLVVVPMKVE
jgi:hypothetical protein